MKILNINTAKLYYASRKSYSILSGELGILSATLVEWIHSGKYKPSVVTGGKRVSTAELEEHRRLRKELAIVKQERDILKKAVAIFSLGDKL